MSTGIRPGSLLRWLVVAAAMAGGCDVCAETKGTNSAKILLHQDGTKTVSSSDLTKGELREATYDSRGVLLSKRIVLINDQSLPVQGVIYNGNDELVGRVEFYYDRSGRVAEERSMNAAGKVFRRKFQLYDQSGKPLTPKIVDYTANAPRIASNSINFTNVPSGGAKTPSGSQPPKLPGQAPQIQSVSPRTKPAEKPRSIFPGRK